MNQALALAGAPPPPGVNARPQGAAPGVWQPATDPQSDASLMAGKLLGATSGFGTDAEAMRGAIADKSPEEMAAIRAAYAQQSGGVNLDDLLSDELPVAARPEETEEEREERLEREEDAREEAEEAEEDRLEAEEDEREEAEEAEEDAREATRRRTTGDWRDWLGIHLTLAVDGWGVARVLLTGIIIAGGVTASLRLAAPRAGHALRWLA